MVQTMSNYASMLKEYYNTDRVAKLVLESSPLLAMLPKKEIFGESFDTAMLIGDTAGHSASFSTAQTNKGQSVPVKFQLTTKTVYGLASLERRLMLASRTNAGAFLPAARTNIDGAFRQVRRDMAIHAFRDGSGARGRVSTFSAGVIQLSVIPDAVNFTLGDVLKFCATKTGGSVEAGTFTVTAINTSAGTLTGTSAGGVSIDANDYIYVDGDYDAVPFGLAKLFPATAPTSGDSLYGLDRSIHPTMLAGVISNGSGKLRYEALIDAASDVGTVGDGSPTHVFMHPTDMRAMVKEMEAQVVRPRPVASSVPVSRGSKAAVGFDGIVVTTDVGDIECYSDRFAEPNKPYMLELNTLRLCHIGPQLADIVGRESDEGMLTEGSSDGYEVRVAAYENIVSEAPGHNAVIINFGL